MSAITLRQMKEADLPTVSALGIASKASWGYTAEQMAVFAGELTIGEKAFSELLVAEVATAGKKMLGYLTIRRQPDGAVELEHLFVAPDQFRRGIGTKLFNHAVESAAFHRIDRLTIYSDPNASGFYERFGAHKIGDHQSSIPFRTIPIYEIAIGFPSELPNASH